MLPRTPLTKFLLSPKVIPFIILLIAFVFRFIAASWLPENVLWRDGYRYETIALNILDGKGFGSIVENRRAVPTQPILIATVYSIFGKDYFMLRLFFALIGSLTCVVGYYLVNNIFSRQVAIIAGLILAFYPYFIYISGLFEYPQTFFIFLMSLFFLFYYRFIQLNKYGYLFISGLIIGLATLSVPTVLIFIPLVFLHLLQRVMSVNLKRLLVISIAISIPLGAWALRNYKAYDEFILINSASGINFWLANNDTYYKYGKISVVPPCRKGYEETTYCIEKKALKKELSGKHLGDMEYIQTEEARAWEKGIQFIKANPEQTIKLSGRKFLEFWSPFPNTVSNRSNNRWSKENILSLISYMPVLLLAIIGVYLTRREWYKLLPVYAYFFALTAPYIIFLPTTRYRLPLDFFLIMFAAVTLWHIGKKLINYSPHNLQPKNRKFN